MESIRTAKMLFEDSVSGGIIFFWTIDIDILDVSSFILSMKQET